MMIPIMAGVYGALTIFVLFGLFSGSFSTNRRQILDRARRMEDQRLGARRRDKADSTVGAELLRDDSLSSNAQIASLLGRFSWAERRAKSLEQGDVPIKVGEYALMLFTAALAGAALTGFLTGFPPAGFVVGIFVVLIGEIWVGRRATKRREKFSRQLPNALQMMAVSMQSGFGIMDAIRTVSRDMEKPLSSEFSRILDETRAGGSFEDALDRLAQRMGGSDLHIVVQALTIHRQVGGDLGGILEQVAVTMREREKLRRDIGSLTAQERMSATIVAALPFWALGFFIVTDKALVEALWTTQLGQILSAVAIGLEIVGFILMRRATTLEA